MAVSTRLIKRRIKSVGNTKKITGAMELVAASKMRKAVAATSASRPYFRIGKEMIEALSEAGAEVLEHPLFRENAKAKRALLIIIASDRGLAGGYNAQLLKKTIEFIKKETQNGTEFDYITVGKKSQDAVKRMNGNIIAAFLNMSNNPGIVSMRPISDIALREFAAGKYCRVFIAYTDFVSSLRQIPAITELLPLRKEDIEIESGKQEKKTKKEREYIFEPNSFSVLDAMLPRLVETEVFQAILESAASEHSARMLAMRNATDAARDMIDDLTFTFNQARQAGITREISEIAAGKAALE
ncbi:ATP synthase F1 subunit gamma [Candidatus Uhrbacteria bacterium]|nr:ATP synthase F1 subunit gamma [Candidatus Uhrbacteria bacterium]